MPREAGWPRLRAFLPPLNFITVHYAYFILVILVTSLVFWRSSVPARSITYVDSLFLVVSAMTEAGLNTVNLSQMTTWQQVLLFLLILLGGAVWVSVWTVAFRLRVFESRFEDIVKAGKARKPPPSSRARARAMPFSRTAAPLSGPQAAARGEQAQPHIVFSENVQMTRIRGANTTASAYATDGLPRKRDTSDHDKDEAKADMHSILTDKTGRAPQFHSLTEQEREQLGGYEYRALKLLSIVVPLYFALWQLLGCLALGAWIARNKPEVATSNGLSPWWTGIFFGVSAFNNSGMALLDANVIPLQDSYFVLVVMGAMILAGNTAYPILLRFIFWALASVLAYTPQDSYHDLKGTLQLILRYPRRVYTHMFPARQTWWLLFIVCLLNMTDWVAFEALNLGNPAIEAIPVGARIIDGLFQAIAVRSGGFYVVPISVVYIGLQILYVIMMYISVYPVVITMRHSNVYEERSLGIYANEPISPLLTDPERGEKEPANGLPTRAPTGAKLSSTLKRHFALNGVGVAAGQEKGADGRLSFVRQQIQGQVAHDIWFLVLAVLAISTIETRHFLADPLTYSPFNVIFEVVSAYGTVGISTGLPNAAYSFSGGCYTGSKLVLCLVMLRGRHRGLPVALDRAVRLPGQDLRRDEEEDWKIRRSMTGRRPSVDLHLH